MIYIGTGSNLNNPQQQIERAYGYLVGDNRIDITGKSSFYRTPPLGPQDQPDYINSVVAITTDYSPLELLRFLQGVEQQMGRVKTGRWRERVIDLDILVYKNRVIKESQLTIPHQGIPERAFVLYPLAEVAPELEIPEFGKVADLKAKCTGKIKKIG